MRCFATCLSHNTSHFIAFTSLISRTTLLYIDTMPSHSSQKKSVGFSHSFQNRPSSLALFNVFPLFIRSFHFQFLFNSLRASLFISSHVHFYLSHSSFPILKMSPRAPVLWFTLTAGGVCVRACAALAENLKHQMYSSQKPNMHVHIPPPY
jgi:hypothetical protein